MIKHKFNCTVSDDPVAEAAGQVIPSNWNDNHKAETADSFIVSGVSGDLEEVSYSSARELINAVSKSGDTMTGTLHVPDFFVEDPSDPVNNKLQIFYDVGSEFFKFDTAKGVTYAADKMQVSVDKEVLFQNSTGAAVYVDEFGGGKTYFLRCRSEYARQYTRGIRWVRCNRRRFS